MKVQKILGFVVAVGKDTENIDDSEIHGSEIAPSNKLFIKLADLFKNSEKDCDIQIRFIPKNGEQENEVRSQIVKLCKQFTLKNCNPLVKSLVTLTDNKIKEGLLFFIYGKEGKTETKLLIARYPSEEAITVKQNGTKCTFEVVDDVFLKNSRRYKAVYYKTTLDNFWSGYAVDKQINDNSLKEISDYWIKDFLQSELKLNSTRGSEQLAKTIRKTIDETKNDQVKEELIAVTPLVKNIDKQALTFKTFFDKMRLSKQTKDEVLSKVDNQRLCEISFQFDSTVFSTHCNYLYKFLDTGAIAMAPAALFPTVWNEEIVGNGKVKYSAAGKKVKTKISNRI